MANLSMACYLFNLFNFTKDLCDSAISCW